MQNGQNEGIDSMQKQIKDTRSKLNEKLMQLEETGPTALGPALLTSIAIAS
jgi:hypothetical protein